jgi:hypothetical protein
VDGDTDGTAGIIGTVGGTTGELERGFGPFLFWTAPVGLGRTPKVHPDKIAARSWSHPEIERRRLIGQRAANGARRAQFP